jgi:DNA polymerase/3'-5' exonuclease PolX
MMRAAGIVRLIEIYVCDQKEKGAALLSATGPKEFNILIRKKAAKMGMKLNQHGLYKDETLIARSSETEILSKLKLKYYKPEDRGSTTVLEEIIE